MSPGEIEYALARARELLASTEAQFNSLLADRDMWQDLTVHIQRGWATRTEATEKALAEAVGLLKEDRSECACRRPRCRVCRKAAFLSRQAGTPPKECEHDVSAGVKCAACFLAQCEPEPSTPAPKECEPDCIYNPPHEGMDCQVHYPEGPMSGPGLVVKIGPMRGGDVLEALNRALADNAAFREALRSLKEQSYAPCDQTVQCLICDWVDWGIDGKEPVPHSRGCTVSRAEDALSTPTPGAGYVSPERVRGLVEAAQLALSVEDAFHFGHYDQPQDTCRVCKALKAALRDFEVAK